MRSRLAWPTLAYTALTTALAPLGYMTMMDGFHPYDDEGYFLISLKDYVDGGPLFTQALPVYGPFFYEVMGGVFRILGIEPSLDSGRIVTLVVWLVVSILGGIAAHRLTGSLWFGIAGQLLTFRVLVALANEPMHPAGLLSLLLVGLMVAAASRSRWPRASAAVIGALVGALLMVKLNVGIFAAVAVVLAWTASLTRWRRLAVPATVVLIVAMPPLLMSGLVSQRWALELALLVSLSAAAFGVVVITGRWDSLPAASTGWIAAGAAFVVLASLGIAFLGGTHVDAWVRSLTLTTKFPQIFFVPAGATPNRVGWSALSLVGALLVSGPLRSLAASPWAGLVRILVGLLIWLSLILIETYLLVLPLTWVAALAPRHAGDDPVEPYARLMLPALAIVGGLQIYPVAGTQLSTAELLLMPVGAICLIDGVRQLGDLRHRFSIVPKFARWTPVAVAAAVVAALAVLATVKAQEFRTFAPLALPGAEQVRVPEGQGAQLRGLALDIDRRCSSFITYPGMDSLYFWTRQRPPVELSSEVWWLVLDDGQQQALVDRLRGEPGLCVVKNQGVIDFWAAGRGAPPGSLVKWIDGSFLVAGSYGGYDLLMPREGR
jgi:hypothetical protein